MVIHHLFRDDERLHRQAHTRIAAYSLELVSIKPIDEIKVEDVTEHAQVSRRTFYKCFKNVNDLLTAIAKKEGQVLFRPIISSCATIPDLATRIATKTRLAIRAYNEMPVFARLLLKVEPPFDDDTYCGYQDIAEDLKQGIAQGRLTDMPLKIGMSLIICTLRGAALHILNSSLTQEYERQLTYHLLLSLGVEATVADEISTMPLDVSPIPERNGLAAQLNGTRAKQRGSDQMPIDIFPSFPRKLQSSTDGGEDVNLWARSRW